jgi:hypothetical protein
MIARPTTRAPEWQARALALLNEELCVRGLPLRASEKTVFTLERDFQIKFLHGDGIRSVLCEAARERLYIVEQKHTPEGLRIGEKNEQELRNAYRVVHARLLKLADPENRSPETTLE